MFQRILHWEQAGRRRRWELSVNSTLTRFGAQTALVDVFAPADLPNPPQDPPVPTPTVLQQKLSQELVQAIGWLAQRHTDYAPFWWHPALLSELCAQALALDLYPEVVERIFLNHLRAAGKDALRTLLYTTTPAIAQRAYRLLHALGDAVTDLVAHLPAGTAKTMLAALLQSGKLIPATYPRLEQELMTAAHRPKPNPTLMAVFGLYVNGASRGEIAEQLECSLPNVRNYITAIYDHFGIKTTGFATQRARWKALVAMAKEQGFMK